MIILQVLLLVVVWSMGISGTAILGYSLMGIWLNKIAPWTLDSRGWQLVIAFPIMIVSFWILFVVCFIPVIWALGVSNLIFSL